MKGRWYKISFSISVAGCATASTTAKTAEATDQTTSRYLLEINRSNNQSSDRSNFAVDRFDYSVHCTSITGINFFWVSDWWFFEISGRKTTASVTFPISRLAVVFRSMSKKTTDLKLKKNVALAIDLLWAMSSKSLTTNFNRSRYQSFEWFISHRNRSVVLSVVRAVAQLTKDTTSTNCVDGNRKRLSWNAHEIILYIYPISRHEFILDFMEHALRWRYS